MDFQAQRRSCSQWLQHESSLLARFGCQWLVPPAQSTCEAWATPCWSENRAEPLQGSSFVGKNWKSKHLCRCSGFNSLDVVPGEGAPCLFDVSQSLFQALGEDSMTSHCSEANNQTEGLQQLDALAKIKSSGLVLRIFIHKKIREHYRPVEKRKTEATFRPSTWLVPESINNSLQFQLLTDFVLWSFRASNEIQAVLHTFPKHSLIAAAWLKQGRHV